MSKDRKNLWGMIIPIVVAVLVVVAFAVSGHVTKTLDEDDPTATTTETTTVQETETITASKVTIVAVGDNLIHNTLIDSGDDGSGELDYTALYTQISPEIQAADIAIINQETMLGGSEFDYSGYPLFNTPWEVGEAAIAAGFDIFTCATNHAMDVGYSGIEQECLFFDNHPEVVHVGTYDTEDEYDTITYYTENNITFAILNYTYGTNGISLPEGKSWCVAMMDEEKITEDVEKAKQNADVVIVFPHWGTKNSTEVSDYQEEYVELFSELEVDIVIGTHPHVLQTVEWVENEETGHEMLVYYSLGNFISHQTSVNQLCGGMAKITVEKSGDDVTITSAKLTPIVCWYAKNSTTGNYDFAVYKLADYTDELAASHAQSAKGVTSDYYTELCESIIPDEFLDIS